MDDLVGPIEVCRRFGFHKSTLLRWEAEGKIPAPGRNTRGERVYSQEHLEAIARLVQSRNHRRRYAELTAIDSPDALPKLVELSEEAALFKFVNLSDTTGLAELRERLPLRPATIMALLESAIESFDPASERFRAVIDLVQRSLLAEPQTRP